MHKRKFSCENGWIVLIVNKHEVIQIHSTGLVTSGNDDRAKNIDLIRLLEYDIMENDLHSQQPGKCGVRWPIENE